MGIYTSRLTGFSPVAGIQWVETVLRSMNPRCLKSFSPVAGIQWVETTGLPNSTHAAATGFSPVAGIQWVETLRNVLLSLGVDSFQSRCRDSVG